MARLIAQHIRGSGDQGGAPLPPPHDPYETNNFFALVRTADDLANTLPNYALSDDGKKIAFVRNDDSTLWIASSQGTHARKVFSANVDTHIAWDGTEEVLHTSGLFDLKFSPGGQFVYFQTDLAATSLGLVAFDERTKKVRFVTDANGYTIIKNCEREPSLNGYIVAYRHDYGILVAQATDLYFLLTPRGQRVGPIGPDGENVARFLHDRCGWGEPAPPVKNEAVPAKMRQVNTCGDVAFRHAPLQFLDGTVWQIFYAVRKEKAHVGFGRLQFDDYVDGAMSLEQADNALKECRDLEEDAGGFTQSTH